MVKLKDILGRAPGQPDAFGTLDAVSRLSRLGADADPLHTINAHARQLENLSRAALEIPDIPGPARVGFPWTDPFPAADSVARQLASVPDWAKASDVILAAASGGATSAGLAHLLPTFEAAASAVSSWERLALPGGLHAFLQGQDTLARRLAMGGPALQTVSGQWGSAAFGGAFTGLSAYSEMNARLSAVGSDQLAFARQLSAAGIPGMLDVAGARSFLDAAGLIPAFGWDSFGEAFARRPGTRRVSLAKRKQRIEELKRKEAAPSHVTRAYRLIHETERVLRRILDELMAIAYGEDWPEERLPACKCDRLLKKSRLEGGPVLEHADWAHYSLIMTDPVHHADVFAAGFEEPGTIRELIEKARVLRAAVAHVRNFTPQNLLDLRLVFSTLEAGLAKAMPSVEFDDGL